VSGSLSREWQRCCCGVGKEGNEGSNKTKNRRTIKNNLAIHLQYLQYSVLQKRFFIMCRNHTRRTYVRKVPLFHSYFAPQPGAYEVVASFVVAMTA
jgi:hypothetical protein